MSEIFTSRMHVEVEETRLESKIESINITDENNGSQTRALTPSQMIVEQIRDSWIRNDEGETESVDGGRERVGSMQGLLSFVSGGGISRKKLAKKRSAPALLSTESAQRESPRPQKDNPMLKLGMLAMKSTETLMLSGKKKKTQIPTSVTLRARKGSKDSSDSTGSSRLEHGGKAMSPRPALSLKRHEVLRVRSRLSIPPSIPPLMHVQASVSTSQSGYSTSIPSLVMSSRELPSSPDTTFHGLATPSVASIATTSQSRTQKRVSADLLRNPPPLPVPNEGLPPLPPGEVRKKGSRQSTLKHHARPSTTFSWGAPSSTAECSDPDGAAALRPMPATSSRSLSSTNTSTTERHRTRGRRNGSDLSACSAPWSAMPDKTLSMLLSELDEDHDELREKRMASEAQAKVSRTIAAAGHNAMDREGDSIQQGRQQTSDRIGCRDLWVEDAGLETPSPGQEITECLEGYFKPSPELRQGAFKQQPPPPKAEDLASPIRLRSHKSHRNLSKKSDIHRVSSKASRPSFVPPPPPAPAPSQQRTRYHVDGDFGQDAATTQMKALAAELKLAEREKLDAKAEAVELRIKNIEARTKIQE